MWLEREKRQLCQLRVHQVTLGSLALIQQLHSLGCSAACAVIKRVVIPSHRTSSRVAIPMTR